MLASRISTSAHESKRYVLNPDADINQLDTSDVRQCYQVKLGEQRYQINAALLTFLTYLRRPRTLDEANQFTLDNDLVLPQSAPRKTVLLKPEVQGFIDVLVEKGVIYDYDALNSRDGVQDTKGSTSRKVGYLFIRFPLFSYDALSSITSKLKTLFEPSVVAVSVVLTVVVHLKALLSQHLANHAAMAALTPKQWLGAIVAIYCGVFVHELGHAAACNRYGVRHGPIGIGLYMIYPVFYADVSCCWALPRLRRAVVDIGGVYFQALYGGLCCLLWLTTGNIVWQFVVFSNLAGIVFNLNPFFRFDGYWLVTDLTGFASIQRSCGQLWRYILARMVKNHGQLRRPDFLYTPRHIQVVFVAYAIASITFSSYFVFQIGTAFIPYAVQSTIINVPILLSACREHRFTLEFVRLTFQTALIFLSCWGAVRLLIETIKRGHRAFSIERR